MPCSSTQRRKNTSCASTQPKLRRAPSNAGRAVQGASCRTRRAISSASGLSFTCIAPGACTPPTSRATALVCRIIASSRPTIRSPGRNLRTMPRSPIPKMRSLSVRGKERRMRPSASMPCRLAMSMLSGVSGRRRRGARNTKRRRFVTARYCRDWRRNGSGARCPYSRARARLQARMNSPRRSDGCVAALICSRTFWRPTVPLPDPDSPPVPDHPALVLPGYCGRTCSSRDHEKRAVRRCYFASAPASDAADAGDVRA